MKKQDVYVEVRTKKQARKLKKVLDMFGEKYYEDERYFYEWTINSPVVHFGSGDRWHYRLSGQDKTKVSIKQLRNILAKEHLKEGDVVVSKGKSKFIGIVKSVQLNDDLTIVIYSDNYFKDGEEGCFSGFWNFTRYATEKEKVQNTIIGDAHRGFNSPITKLNISFEDMHNATLMCADSIKRKTQPNEYKVTPKSLEISGDRQAFITMEVHGAGEQFGEAMSEVNDKEFKLVISDKKHEVTTNHTEFEKDQWYALKDNEKILVCYQKKHDGYGFDSNGGWRDNIGISNVSEWRKATKEEVEKQLIIESKRRLLVKGVKIKSEWCLGGVSTDTLGDRYFYSKISNELVVSGNGVYTLFKDGKWATIIEETPEQKVVKYAESVD